MKLQVVLKNQIFKLRRVNMEIALAVLQFLGGVIPLVQELLKAFM